MTLTLTDGTAFNNTDIKHVDTFQYSRKFSTTGWMTTVLPVTLSYSDWSSKFEIANITGVTVKLKSNGLVESFTLKKSILSSGATINPNLPYLIRAKTANANASLTIKKTNCDVYPSTPKELTFVSGDYKFIVRGTYEKLTSSSIYISSKEVWNIGTSIGPFRAYVVVVKNEPVPEPEPVLEPSSDIWEAYTKLSNRITLLEQKLDDKVSILWNTIGEFSTANNTTIANTFSLLSDALNEQNERINQLQSIIENVTPGDGNSNPNYESRISTLERRIGNINIEVTD